MNIVIEFQNWLIEDGKAKKTLESYVGDVRAFIKWIEGKEIHFNGMLKRFHITAYRSYLVQEGYEVNTINKKINSLQSFNTFLISRGYINNKVIDLKKDKVKVALGSEKEVQVLSNDEIEKLLFYIQNESVTLRDKMIILLLLYTGVRVSELVNIKLKDIDILSLNVTITWGKGCKRREIPLKNEIIKSIKEYLEDRKYSKFSNSEYLILTNRANKMDRDAVNRILKSIKLKLNKKLEH